MNRQRLTRMLAGCLFAVAMAMLAVPVLLAQQGDAAKPLRVLVVTGGHHHDASFYDLFEHQPDIAAVIEPHPSAFTKNLIRDFDAIALYDMVQIDQVPEAQRAKFKAFAEAGKGIFVIHHAVVSYQGWEWYWRELVGGRYLLSERDGLPKSDYKHDVEMTVTPEGTHPIVRGVKPFRVVDEAYGHMQILPASKVLLRSDDAVSTGPVAWLSPYKDSRVVVLELGHDRQAHENPAFREVFRRCLLWAGGRLPE